MKISPIASGSNGNCIYIETDSAKVLIDMGISFVELERRMNSIGRDPKDLSACFVTHEHRDHVAGVGILSRKLNIPIYMNKETYNSASRITGVVPSLIFLNGNVSIGNTNIQHFNKSHDAANPISFVVEDKNKRFGIITDTGFLCNNTKECMSTLDGVLLESNYDPNMLDTCRYPQFLKMRISGERGHLSNEECGILVLDNARPKLRSVFLGHLSENSNTPELAFKTFKSIVSHRKDLNLDVVVTSRYDCTGIYDI